MISLLEKEMALESSENYFNGTNGKLLFKILSNYLANTSDLGNTLKDLDESVFNNDEQFKEYSKIIISYMADIASKTYPSRNYTTGQLSTLFGVSITTINNWIREGRFIGYTSKGKKKQARINENVFWLSPIGELLSIKDIAEMYVIQNSGNITEEEEHTILLSEIKFFEDKYQGSYQETLEKIAHKSEVEERDASEWRYLLYRLKA